MSNPNKRLPPALGSKKRGRQAENDMMEGEVGAMAPPENQFDDDFSDIEDDGEVVDCQSNDEDENMNDEEEDEAEIARRLVYRPGIDEMPEGAEMTYDSSAYDMYHKLSVDWPCLSFDIVADSMGASRTKYPMSCYWACGSQAAGGEDNYIGVMKSSQLCKTRFDDANESASDASDDEDDDDLDANPEQDPILETKLTSDNSAFNRIRCMPQRTTIVAGWSESGVVKILDFSDQFKQLDNPGEWVRENVAAGGAKAGAPPRLLYTTPTGPNGHTSEGYGLAWSLCNSGSLASGDCDGNLRHWTLNESGNVTGSKLTDTPAPGSIEDIKWSSHQPTVMIAGLTGGNCQVYDTRSKGAKISWMVNDGVDVNVLDWNPHKESNHLVTTGSDDGGLHIWDLRKIQKGGTKAAQTYSFLKSPITSLEYSPFNENLLAVASDDNQVSLWDFSIERDAEEEAVMAARHPELAQFPAQLVFQHMGLQSPKELHWHPQLPCVVIVTDLKGFDIFKPSNWKSLIR